MGQRSILHLLDSLLRDGRQAVRMLARSPGFALPAILCLTLGIGADVAVLSWIEGLLLRPFPAVAEQDRLVVLAGTTRDSPRPDDVSWPDLLDLRRSCTLIDSFIADKIMGTTLSIGNRAERAAGSVVSANYFAALGVRPLLGRGFEAVEESGRNGHPVTVISYWMWKERFRGDPAIVGKTQRLNGVQHTIVGVAPEGFYGTFVGYPIQFWVPISMQETFEPGGYKLEDRGARWIEGYARLKPGVDLAQAQAEIAAVAKRLEAAYPATDRGRGIQLLPLWKDPFTKTGELLPTLQITFVVVTLVLLIACANVSGLLLVRALARRHEMTVRMALGSGRGRLVRQLLLEGLILSTLSAAGGSALAYACRNALVFFFRSQAAVNLRGEMDGRVLACSAGVCLISTLLFALIPAVQASKVDLATALKADSAGVVGGHGRSRLRSGLVLVQVSLSFILLVGAGLILQSLKRLGAADPGFSTRDVLTTGIDLVSAGYDAPRAKLYQDGLIERIRALGGVESAAWMRVRPFTYIPYSSAPIVVEGYAAAPDEQPAAEYDEVGPDYFRTMRIPLLSGRELIRADDETAPLVAVVNEKMAAKYWGKGGDPIGKRFQVKGRWLRVIGVAKLAKYETFLETPAPFFYVPLRQSFSVRAGLMVRITLDPRTMTAALAREINAFDPNVAAPEVIPLREHMNRSALASQQTAVTLLSVFGGLALLLAAVGLYGVMSYAVSQSARELGLRMALGARGLHLLRLVMSHGLALTAAGVVLGAAAALGLTRFIGKLLYQVDPRDPAVFAWAVIVMAVVASAASFFPAWRATRIDPVRVLRA